jgi:hypothetical protein
LLPWRPLLLLLLQVLPQLQAQFPIERAKMRLKLQVAAAATPPLLQMLAGHGAAIETCDDTGAVATVITQVGWGRKCYPNGSSG